MKTYHVILGAAGEHSFEVMGDFVKVLSASGRFELRAEKDGRVLSDVMELQTGFRPKFDELFHRIRVRDLSGSANAIDLTIGRGDHDTPGGGTTSVDNFAASSLDSSADVSLVTAASHDLAADATRRELIIDADETNSGNLRVRDQSGTTDEGPRLRPGQTLTLPCSGAVRIRNNSGATQIFSIAETKN
jgi:hypothetical protein